MKELCVLFLFLHATCGLIWGAAGVQGASAAAAGPGDDAKREFSQQGGYSAQQLSPQAVEAAQQQASSQGGAQGSGSQVPSYPYYYYYPQQAAASSAQEDRKDLWLGGFKLVDLLPIAVAILIVAVAFFFFYPSVTTVTAKSLKDAGTEGLNELTSRVTAALEREECAQRVLCRAGGAFRGFRFLPPALRMAEGVVPETLARSVRALRNSLLDEDGDCSQYSCAALDPPYER